VVIVGLSVTVAPVTPIGFQEYELAPETVKVISEPAHTTVGFAPAVIVGFALTVIVIATDPVQLPELPNKV
jgi:hypothetical protein